MADWCEKADTVLTRALGSMEAPYTSANDVSELWMTWAYQKRRAADAGLCSYEKAAEVSIRCVSPYFVHIFLCLCFRYSKTVPTS